MMLLEWLQKRLTASHSIGYIGYISSSLALTNEQGIHELCSCVDSVVREQANTRPAQLEHIGITSRPGYCIQGLVTEH